MPPRWVGDQEEAAGWNEGAAGHHRGRLHHDVRQHRTHDHEEQSGNAHDGAPKLGAPATLELLGSQPDHHALHCLCHCCASTLRQVSRLAALKTCLGTGLGTSGQALVDHELHVRSDRIVQLDADRVQTDGLDRLGDLYGALVDQTARRPS